MSPNAVSHKGVVSRAKARKVETTVAATKALRLAIGGANIPWPTALPELSPEGRRKGRKDRISLAKRWERSDTNVGCSVPDKMPLLCEQPGKLSNR
jgi:hypothetical protein